MKIDGTISLEVKESAIRDLDKGLMDNVGIGPRRRSVLDIMTVLNSSQDAEL